MFPSTSSGSTTTQNEGQFDFSGQRDLKRFVEICGRHGLYVVVRVGPWVHAEVRNGGLPDWVLKNGPVRQNDPVYLREVDSYFKAVGAQLHGQLWKDGGPVIGVQIENEYNLTGPGKGMEHIRTLKAAVIAAGLDVPLYTVTGWDGAAIPLDAVLPVFGGYPDAPWAGTSKPMPANEIYAFRFNNRAAGSMGAIGGEGQNSASTYSGTPFLTAEVGDGIEDTYFRRPVVSADDVAAIVPVMLGSGVNLLGYYMFHGGRNPDGGAITLQESQRTGYPTDVPLRSYDFQAPLGEFGQERESLRKLKLVHYFLNDFGSSLATMAPRVPSVVPESPSDASRPRVAARTLGEHGFVFFNNHVRSLAMPHRPGFQVELQLPSGTLRVPQEPIDLPADAYGIWPVNLDIGSSILRYSTAQIFKRVVQGAQTSYWFFAIPGVVPEVLLAPRTEVLTTSPGVRRSETPEGVRLRAPSNSEATVRLAGGVTLVILPEVRAEQVWRVEDPSMLLLTAADAFSDGRNWTLMSDGKPQVPFGVFGAGNAPRAPGVNLRPGQHELVFQQFVAEVPSVVLKAQVTKGKEASLRAPWTMGPAFAWRSQPVPLAPEDHDFEGAAEWTIHLPKIAWSPTLSDVFVRVDYAGDEARLYQDGKILDDNFWNGLPFTTGWRELDRLDLRSPVAHPPAAAELPDVHRTDDAAALRWRRRRQAGGCAVGSSVQNRAGAAGGPLDLPNDQTRADPRHDFASLPFWRDRESIRCRCVLARTDLDFCRHKRWSLSRKRHFSRPFVRLQ